MHTLLVKPEVLGMFWIAGMLSYAAAYYYNTFRGTDKPGFWIWLIRMDVLTTKVLGLAAAGLWLHSWKSPALQWLDNIMPRRPFASFVFGFFGDVIALQARKLIKQKFSVDLGGKQ